MESDGASGRMVGSEDAALARAVRRPVARSAVTRTLARFVNFASRSMVVVSPCCVPPSRRPVSASGFGHPDLVEGGVGMGRERALLQNFCCHCQVGRYQAAT